MRIVFFLAVWRRPEITELCFMGLQRLMEYVPGSSAFAVISEESMIPLCEKYGVEYTMYPNNPVGMKKNAGLSVVMKKDFDYLIELGSDDIILNKAIDLYLPHMEAGEDFFGTKRLLMVDAIEGTCREWFYDPELVQGLGRCMSKKMLKEFTGKVCVKALTSIISEEAVISEGDTGYLSDRLAKEMVQLKWAEKQDSQIDTYLWDPIDRGLDNNSTARIMKKGYKYKEIETADPLMADIKSDENIWGFNPEIGDPGNLEAFINGMSQKEKSKFFANQKALRAKRIERATA